MRTPTCRSSPFTCSSCWPSSSRKRRASAKRSSAGAGAVSAKRLPAPGAEQLVGGGERLVEPGGILPAGLREVGPPAAPTAHQRRELLDDVASVVAAGEILRHPGDQEGALAVGSTQHDHPRLDPIAHASHP